MEVSESKRCNLSRRNNLDEHATSKDLKEAKLE